MFAAAAHLNFQQMVLEDSKTLKKAADDVREKIATVRSSLRTEVKEPRVVRFDPSSRAIWSRSRRWRSTGSGLNISIRPEARAHILRQ